MSIPVAFSIPSRPGDEFTSITIGPFAERNKSTPQKFKPMILAALTAVSRSSLVNLTTTAEPPRCKLERNSPSAP